ncbi:hypothetical protein [Pedobacter agri]|uniref:hypothetical protein n=1 Tax=Pedobacter agri TaxID=454586 RepID=UPI00292EBBD0|nr:hypothetical protein [Pedobacter agri]
MSLIFLFRTIQRQILFVIANEAFSADCGNLLFTRGIAKFFFVSPAAASFFSLNNKEANNQGLDLILNKPTNAFYCIARLIEKLSMRIAAFLFNKDAF